MIMTDVRCQVYKNCNPGLALRVYQMTYANSFEEDRFLSTMQREAEAFKKLIDDRQVGLSALRVKAGLTNDGRTWSFPSTTMTQGPRCGIVYRDQRPLTHLETPAEVRQVKNRG